MTQLLGQTTTKPTHKVSRTNLLLSLLVVGLLIGNLELYSAYSNLAFAALPTKWDSQGADCPFAYCILTDGTTYWARNGSSGVNQFSGTNPRTVIQNAINNTSAGGVVFLTAGTYTFTTGFAFTTPAGASSTAALRLADKVTLLGEGQNATILTQADSTNLGIFITTKHYTSEVSTNAAVTIKNLGVEGNYEGQTCNNDALVMAFCAAGIKLYDDYAVVENFYANNTGEYGGLEVLGSYGQFNNILVTNVNERNASRLQYATGVIVTYSTSQGNQFSNIRVKNAGSGLFFEDEAHDNVVTGLFVEDARYAGLTIISASNNTVQGGSIINSAGYGVFLWTGTASPTLLTANNRISGLQISNSDDSGIQLSSAMNNTITGNVLFNNGITTGDEIQLASSSATYASMYNVVTGNRITGYGNADYLINEDSSNSNYNLYDGNVFKGTTSSGTLVRLQGANSVMGNYGGIIQQSITMFVPATSGTEAYEYWRNPVYRINADDENATISFMVPANFRTVVSVNLVWAALAGTVGMTFNVNTAYRASGEVANTHSTSINITRTTTNNFFYTDSISSAVSSLAAGDIVGVRVSRLTGGNGTLVVVGVQFVYLTTAN